MQLFKTISIGIVFLPFAASALRAEEPPIAADNILACAAMKDKKSQVECLEKAASEKLEKPTLSTPQALQSFTAGDYKTVDPKDLQLGPRKFIGKPIELLNMQCYYADIEEYRCWSAKASMTVFAKTIVEYPNKDKFDEFCGRQKNTASAGCRKTLHIIPKSAGSDRPNAFGSRTTIHVNELRFAESSAPARQSR